MEYDIKLSQAATQLVLQALGEIPLKHSLPIFAAVQKQIQEQDAKAAVPISNIQPQAAEPSDGR